MSETLLEAYTRQYISAQGVPEVTFAWQGGEPTLMGLGFYRKVVEFQRKYARPGQKVENDLQTNGTLLDDEWCAFLKENGWLVGLSIDGPKELHDQCRVTKGGKPTFDEVYRAAMLLKKHEVPFNTLTCVHRYNASRPLEVYRFLRQELGSNYIQFIPIVEPKGFDTVSPAGLDWSNVPRDGTPEAEPGHPDSVATEWSVEPEAWGEFLCAIFDEWLRVDIGEVMINHFESLVSARMGLGSQMCVTSEVCGKGLAMEHDGSVYSCDHYVYPEFRLGNVHQKRLRDSVLSRQQVKFGHAKSETLPGQCRRCEFLRDCWGECPKNRILRTADGEPGLNYLCRGLLKFYRHATPEIDRIVADLRRGVLPVPRGV